MAVWPERGKEPEMILRRGIFLGVIMIAGSVQAICGGYGPEAARFVWIWWITLLVGIVQLGVSFHYRMSLLSRIMQFCLALEGIYYIGKIYRFRMMANFEVRSGIVQNIRILMNDKEKLEVSKKMGVYINDAYDEWKKQKKGKRK